MVQEAIRAPSPATSGVAWHALTVEEALAQQTVDQSAGLTAAEATSRRATHGPNKLTAAVREPRWQAFLRQYRDAMQIVLFVAGVTSLFLPSQFWTGVMLLGLTLLNALLGLSQEGKAEASAAALRSMLVMQARALRDGEVVQIPMEDLVPGDIVMVEAGDLVPADGRLLRAATLEIDEAALTGESAPVPKQVEAVAADAALGDRVDLAFMNTQVTRGVGTILVTATGMATEVGHISGMLQAEKSDVTPLTKQLNKLTNQILVVAGAALIISIGLGLWREQPFDELFLAAIAFAVAAIPTGLPAVTTAILASGSTTLAKAGAIVKRLRSVETLGSTSAINSDKTGTLTLNQMTATQMAVTGRRYAITGSGYSTEGQITHVAGEPGVLLDRYMLPMALCADAVVKDGELIGDPTEGALAVLAAKGLVDPVLTRKRYPRIAEVPFDAAYKFMATFHTMKDDDGKDVIRCYVKGAPDQLLLRATTADDGSGRQVPIDTIRDAYLAENERLGRDGLRVIATAQRDLDPRIFDPGADLLPLVSDLTLLAIVGIVDPPRPEAKASIAKAYAAGITVRMITGDHAVTAEAIARQLGISGRAITGAEFEAMSDDEVDREIDGIGVIARVAPEDKVRLVDVLKRKGHVVAMTGDGVNDAPALRRADIGVAMGITGSEVSKEAAVMILTDDDFATIVKAVELGRALYDNLLRFIRYNMGGLFGFIATFLGASLLFIAEGVPFTPIQTLWVNFTVTAILAVGLGFSPPRPGLMEEKPRSPDAAILPPRWLASLAFIGFVLAVITLSVIWWAGEEYGDAVARTMGLAVFSLANIWLALETSDLRRSVFSPQILENPTLIKMAGMALIVSIATVELGALNRLLGTVGLTSDQWVICSVVSLAVIVVAEIAKLLHVVEAPEADVVAAETVPAPEGV